MTFQFICDHKSLWPIGIQCHVLSVSRAVYYKCLSREPSKTAQVQEQIVQAIKRIRTLPRHDDYGSPRMHRVLLRNGYFCCKNTVARLMQREGFKARVNRKFKVSTTDSNHDFPIAPNLLEQHFKATCPNQIWLTDFTYILTKEGFTYLCTIEDLYSRKIIGWATSRKIDTDLALTALFQAMSLRSSFKGLILHSDRGSHYASTVFRQWLLDLGVQQSMSRKGNCYDNAPMESFFKSFKVEEVYRSLYETHEEATRGVADYIERFYNRTRLHSSLGYFSPIDYEKQRLWEVSSAE